MRFFFIIFLAMIYSIELFAWEIMDKRLFDQYSVLIEHDEEWVWHRVTISKDGQQLYQIREAGHYFYIGNKFSDKEKGAYQIKDINKNGIPDLIISENAMGTVCCHILHILELGNSIKETKIVAGNRPIMFVDYDKDGINEIEFWDNAIVGVFASTAGSPFGRVVYKYDGKSKGYRVSSRLMRSELDRKWLNEQKKKIVQEAKEKTPDLPYAFLDTLMNLSYSGHFDKALKAIEEFSPILKRDASEFKKEFRRILDDSVYWKEFSAEIEKEKI